ncbi:haloacid dehalogenase superfamily, subfamily IA, variant 3 with third motif having DD or ED [Paracoccus halophilus]|uniref:phosphoglycolate phosphatase n=1 Tax=Paracoccus halophilus TaxID=376733 RepID=A0A099F1A9_9RHOB|nr:HAD family phosphatase [Paracoccus halophilus]KGJ04264.1 hydrolase [Paracoccus halophilus]SFA52206.1 haloacid dehalogenase superfamily, subfamily IA, variant 3 with third motif having DD or ED [Paracoccus halophilus]
MTPKAVIFDCDGVVVDSEPATLKLLRSELAERGLPLSEAQLAEGFIGHVMPDIATKARGLGADLPADWAERFYERLYAHLAQGVELIPGILQVLDRLEAAGIPFGIGSNGSERKMRVTLGQHPGLTERFQVVMSGQTIARPKPAPDLYLAVARSLGAAPDDCIVIEDSPTGARAARAAGIRCLGYAPHGNEPLAAEGATIFASMLDLPDLLGLR